LDRGTFFKVAPFSKWHHFQSGTIFKVAPFSKWHLFQSGTFFKVAPFSKTKKNKQSEDFFHD
jgi:uncharacterized protein YaiE (UPF0345 family)